MAELQRPETQSPEKKALDHVFDVVKREVDELYDEEKGNETVNLDWIDKTLVKAFREDLEQSLLNKPEDLDNFLYTCDRYRSEQLKKDENFKDENLDLLINIFVGIKGKQEHNVDSLKQPEILGEITVPLQGAFNKDKWMEYYRLQNEIEEYKNRLSSNENIDEEHDDRTDAYQLKAQEQVNDLLQTYPAFRGLNTEESYNSWRNTENKRMLSQINDYVGKRDKLTPEGKYILDLACDALKVEQTETGEVSFKEVWQLENALAEVGAMPRTANNGHNGIDGKFGDKTFKALDNYLKTQIRENQ